MSDSLDLKGLERRGSQYWHADGLPEVVMGVLWILWGSTWLIGDKLPKGPVSRVFWTVAPFALIAACGTAAWLIKSLKKRWTFPRAGYVDWKKPTGRKSVAVLAVGFMSGLVFAAVSNSGFGADLQRIAVPVITVLLSLGFVIAGRAQRETHLVVLGALTLAIGLTVATVAGPGWSSVNWMLVIVGLVTTVAGGLRLAAFVRQHPLEGQSG